jgi:NADH:ubiquinone oxidoreductase subunit
MGFRFVELFAWWTGNTIGTRFTLWKAGASRVGEDAFGNVYYRAPGRFAGERERRWVIYAGEADGSKVPPGWHGWLAYRTDTAPSEESFTAHEWMKPHRSNMTGTAEAYRPAGSILGANERPKATGDYQPWTPR